MTRYGARPLTVTAAQANAGTNLIGGPVRLRGWSMNDGAAGEGLTARGSAAAPAAGTTITSLSLTPGTYSVSWQVELTGTPGAGDVDNVQLLIGATVVAQ